MGIIDQFQKLDDLIVEYTQPPVRTVLRNQLALTREQVEAYQASSDKQDETLANQIKTIESLMAENTALKNATAQPNLRAKYEHLERRGFWIDRETGQRVCGNCFLNGIVSPLTALNFNKPRRRSWVCGRKECRTEYFFKDGDLKKLDAESGSQED